MGFLIGDLTVAEEGLEPLVSGLCSNILSNLQTKSPLL